MYKVRKITKCNKKWTINKKAIVSFERTKELQINISK